MAQGMTYKDFEARMAAARAAHLKNIDITGKKIQGIYTQAARDLAKRAEATKVGTLTERWVKDYQKALEKRIEQLRGELGGTILSGMRKSAGLPGDMVEGWLNDALAMVGVDGSFTSTFSRTPDAALRMLIDGRMYRDGKSLSRRIWNRTDQLQGSIEDILTQGIAQHRSALQIAQDLEAYVSPKAKMPVSWLTLYPDIPFDRQIDYNAQRLARTAINHAYWAANMAAAKANPFCRAMHWQLSPSHYERQVARFGEDICDTYASHDEGLGRGNFPIDDVPMPHAQCLCATWQVVPEISDVADRLGAWVDGGEDAELDAAFGEWKAGKPALTRLDARGTMKLPDVEILRSLGAKSKNYDIYDPATGDYYRFKEGSRIQNREVFAGYGSRTSLHDGVAEGLSEQCGGDARKWQHVKGFATLDTPDGDRKAEVHWFANEDVGQVKHKVKRWLDED